MLNKIKAMFSVMGIKPNTTSTTELIKTTQEDQRDTQTVKRTANYMEQNHELIITRAMMPHGFDCEDNFLCQKQNCYSWQPDKIVSEPYVVAGPQAPKFKLVDVSNKESRSKETIKRENKTIKKCFKGCDNNQYNKCYKCVMGS